MNREEIEVLKKGFHQIVDELNLKFERTQKETLEKVEEMINNRENQRSVSSNYDDNFHRISHYLSMLIDVSSRTEHKLHKEIDEAVEKLKQIAYAERA